LVFIGKEERTLFCKKTENSSKKKEKERKRTCEIRNEAAQGPKGQGRLFLKAEGRKGLRKRGGGGRIAPI